VCETAHTAKNAEVAAVLDEIEHLKHEMEVRSKASASSGTAKKS